MGNRPASVPCGKALSALLRSLLIQAAALCAGALGAAQAESWHYRVSFDPADPLVAKVSVELPAVRRAQDFSVQVRGLTDGVTPQVTDLRCDGMPLAPDSASAWLVQGWRCVRLTWSVPVRPAPETGIDPRTRETFFEPGRRFWLFSEASSLLRPVDDPRHEGVMEIVGGGPVNGGAQATTAQRLMVPPKHRPSEYYAIGRLPGASLREGNIETLHLDALGIEWREWVADHGRALAYLTRTAGTRHLAALRSTVVWLDGVTEEGVPIGVAGHRTLLLSATKRDGQLQHPEVALAWILREQLLQSMPERMPLWARESLAQYYAVKALRRTELPPAAVAAAERRFIDGARGSSVQLLGAQQRALSGEVAALAELRSGGAAFWGRVDRAIVRKSGFRTLDSLLPRLLAADWPDDRLPPAALQRLREYAAEATVDELLTQYLGG